jgi:phage terminase Nu1 subunit (DNA packaging protein)
MSAMSRRKAMFFRKGEAADLLDCPIRVIDCLIRNETLPTIRLREDYPIWIRPDELHEWLAAWRLAARAKLTTSLESGRYFTTDAEVAQHLGWNQQTVQACMRSWSFPIVKAGGHGRYWIEKQALHDWLDARAQKCANAKADAEEDLDALLEGEEEIGSVIGVSERTVRNYLRIGLPVLEVRRGYSLFKQTTRRRIVEWVCEQSQMLSKPMAQ